jgi:hypothetical protein
MIVQIIRGFDENDAFYMSRILAIGMSILRISAGNRQIKVGQY